MELFETDSVRELYVNGDGIINAGDANGGLLCEMAESNLYDVEISHRPPSKFVVLEEIPSGVPMWDFVNVDDDTEADVEDGDSFWDRMDYALDEEANPRNLEAAMNDRQFFNTPVEDKDEEDDEDVNTELELEITFDFDDDDVQNAFDMADFGHTAFQRWSDLQEVLFCRRLRGWRSRVCGARVRSNGTGQIRPVRYSCQSWKDDRRVRKSWAKHHARSNNDRLPDDGFVLGDLKERAEREAERYRLKVFDGFDDEPHLDAPFDDEESMVWLEEVMAELENDSDRFNLEFDRAA